MTTLVQDKLQAGIQHPAFIRFLRFLLVGGSNTLITFLVFKVLMQTNMFNGVVRITFAQTAGYIAGAVWGFVWSRIWAFRENADALSSVRGTAVAQMLRFTIAQSLALAASIALLALFIESLGWSSTLGWVASTVSVTAANFAMMEFWVFRKRPLEKSL